MRQDLRLAVRAAILEIDAGVDVRARLGYVWR
jgi:hypothetical protein